MNKKERNKRIKHIEAQLISTRYSDTTISRDDALFLLTELMTGLNQLAIIKMEDEPFPIKIEKPKREINIGFNSENA